MTYDNMSSTNSLKRGKTSMYQDRIRAAREDADESQRAIAAILGMPQSQYQKYESGTTAMPIRYLKEICLHYKISADYVLDLPKGMNWPR